MVTTPVREVVLRRSGLNRISQANILFFPSRTFYLSLDVCSAYVLQFAYIGDFFPHERN